MMTLGIDPDIRAMPLAAVSDTAGLVSVRMIRVDPEMGMGADMATKEMILEVASFAPFARRWFTHLDLAVVENQRVLERKRNHDDMLRLAQVAGAAAASTGMFARDQLLMPFAQEWKGNLPKPVSQARILGKLGIEYVQQKGGSKPTQKALRELRSKVDGVENVKTAEWVDLVDAIGLALWGIKESKA